MKILILVCGPAAIGKSTFCATYKKEHPGENVKVLSADEVRKDMYGGYDKFPPNFNMMYVYREMIRQANSLYDANTDLTLLFDTTMLYDERRLYFLRHLKPFDKKILVLLKLHDYKKCLTRNKERSKEKWVPENIIVSMTGHYLDPSPDCQRHFDKTLEIYVD